jgi:putative membrane protein
MFCALLGSLTAMTLLVHLHDRSMAAIGKPLQSLTAVQGETAR